MYIRRLAMNNYSTFARAEFKLGTTPDRPLVLITAENGGGKTSTLMAFRLALHGRRAFDVPIAERDYLEWMSSRFHNRNPRHECSIELDFDFVDDHTTRKAQVIRRWSLRRKSLAESLEVLIDGRALAEDLSDDLLASIVPPQVAKYFFFDGERIRELADWEAEDEAHLFLAVQELLGIELITQLGRDLARLDNIQRHNSTPLRDVTEELQEEQARAQEVSDALREERRRGRQLRGNCDRALSNLRRLGVLQSGEL